MDRVYHLQYTCPTHPEVVKDAPGKCPKCGMDLIPVKEEKRKQEHGHHGHPDASPNDTHSPQMHQHGHQGGGHAHHAGMIDDFKRRFYVVLVLTIPIMTLSPMIQHWLRVDWSFTGSHYVLLTLSSVVFFYGGKPFLVGLVDEVKMKSPGIITPVAVAISVAYAYRGAIVLMLEGMD